MFRSFQQTWSSIDQATYEVASDDMFDSHISALREQMVQFCKATLEGLHQRDNYKEFLQPSLIFLGSEKQGFRFGHQKHSIMHVGWRTPSIASLQNISVPSAVLSNYQREASCKRDGAVSDIYIRFWHEPPLAIRAPPLNDLYYLRSSENIQI